MPIRGAAIGCAVALAMVLATTAPARACPRGGEISTAFAALEPDFARPGPVDLAPEAGDVLAWLDAPDDPVVADAALRRLAQLYDLALDEDSEPPALAAGWEDRARSAITAIGIAIVADDGSGRVEAAGVYWSTPLQERLRILSVPPGTAATDLRGLVSALGPLASTCAVTVDEWVRLSEPLVRDVLDRTDGLWMLAYGPPRDPGGEPWSTWVPDRQIEDAVRFAHPGVPDPPGASYSALFYGRGPGLVWTIRNAPRAATTLGPGDFLGWVRSLFR